MNKILSKTGLHAFFLNIFLTHVLCLLLLVCLLAPIRSFAIEKCEATEPQVISLNQIESFAKTPHYTQGVVFFEGNLIESFGMTGHSGLQITSTKDRKEKELIRHADEIFSEGISIYGKKLLQLNYESEFAFVYDINFATQKINQHEFSENHRYQGEGWGLTTYNNQLAISNGSSKIRFVDPNNLRKIFKEITVKYGDKEVDRLNELELVDGNIWANIYGTQYIAVISPATGCIQKLLDLGVIIDSVNQTFSKLQNPICYKKECSVWDFVMNGIAYDKSAGIIYLTGKNWPLYYKVNKNDLQPGD